MLTICTNKNWRPFKYRNEVPAEVLASQFDHLDENDGFDGFILYRNSWYHLSDFLRIEGHSNEDFSSWDGYAGDSYFSGALIKVSEDCESYQIGYYTS